MQKNLKAAKELSAQVKTARAKLSAAQEIAVKAHVVDGVVDWEAVRKDMAEIKAEYKALSAKLDELDLQY